MFSHDFTLGRNSPAASRACEQLAEEGVGMLRFDNLGLGESEGDRGDGSFSHKVADLLTGHDHAKTAARIISAWADSYLA